MNEEQGNQVPVQAETAPHGFDAPQENLVSSVGTVSDIIPEPKRHRTLKIALTFLAVFGTCVLFFPRILTLVTSDIPSVNDADLIPSPHVVADEDNGAFFVDKIAFYETESSRFLFEGTNPWDMGNIETLLEENQHNLDILKLLASKPYFQDPATAYPELFGPTSTPISLSEVRDVAQLSVFASYNANAKGSGHTEEAVQYALLPIQAATLLEQPNTTFISILVAHAIKKTAYDGIETIWKDAFASTSTLQALLGGLEQFNENDVAGMTNAWQMEYLNIKNSFKMYYSNPEMFGTEPGEVTLLTRWLSQGGDLDNFYFRKNKTLDLFAHHTRLQIAQIQQGCSVERGVEIVAPESAQPWFLSENGLGEHLYATHALSFSGVLDRDCVITAHNATLRVALAMRMYELDYQRLPLDISELKDTYLQEIPTDPFTGTPLRYIPTERKIYSVGINRMDDGGVEIEDDIHSGDIVVQF